MKQIIITVLAATALIGCQEAIENVSSESDATTFEAFVEGFSSDTKTSLTELNNIVWSEGDNLAIFQGCSVADKYQLNPATAGTSNGKFSLVSDNSGEVNGDFSSGMEVATNVALYPYAENLSCANARLTDTENSTEVTAYAINGVVLPEVQNYVAGSFGNASFPMTAVTETLSDHTLKFKNVCGAMKLQFKGTQLVKSIKIEGGNAEKLSGAATVTAYPDADLAPVITMSSDASTSVTLNCGEGVQLSESEATDFIIALPPVLFSKGFKVTVTTSEDETKVIEASVANTIIRSSILVMPTIIINDDIVEDDGEDSAIKVLDIAFDKTKLTLAPGTSYSIITTVVPDTAEDKTLTWSSSAPAIATVDQSGVVTAVSDGTATVTAVAVGGVSKSCTVNVVSVPQATATVDYVDEYNVNHGKGIAIGGTVWAPVNCGYKAATVVDGLTTDKGFPYGKLYQWGRKYGQGYSADDDSEPTMFNGPVSATVGQNEATADYFYIGSSDWAETRDDKMWNNDYDDAPVKTATDPCPIGWRVPTFDELNALHRKHSSWTTNDARQEGIWFSGVSTTNYDTAPLSEGENQVFFPAAGYRNRKGDADSRGSYGYYWSSMPNGSSARNIRFYYTGYVAPDGDDRASGFSVRCVQE